MGPPRPLQQWPDSPLRHWRTEQLTRPRGGSALLRLSAHPPPCFPRASHLVSACKRLDSTLLCTSRHHDKKQPGKGMVKALRTDTVAGKSPRVTRKGGSRVRRGREFLRAHRRGQWTQRQARELMDRQLPVMPRSEQTSIAVRRGHTTRELEHHKLTLTARKLALHLRLSKRAANQLQRRHGLRSGRRGMQAQTPQW